MQPHWNLFFFPKIKNLINPKHVNSSLSPTMCFYTLMYHSSCTKTIVTSYSSIIDPKILKAASIIDLLSQASLSIMLILLVSIKLSWMIPQITFGPSPSITLCISCHPLRAKLGWHFKQTRQAERQTASSNKQSRSCSRWFAAELEDFSQGLCC